MNVRLSDVELQRFIEGPYTSIVQTVALVCDSTASAEDAVHEALARALTQRQQIVSLERWVLTVALNIARSRWRRLGREKPLGAESPIASEAEHPNLDLHAAIRSLPTRQREVVILHYLQDMSVAQIAEITKLTEGGVKHALYRGRRSLAARLAPTSEEVTHERP